MEVRFQNSPNETKQMDTKQLRENFLIEDLTQKDKLKLVYSHYDRVIVGGVSPVDQTVELPNEPELKAAYFLERRELGVVNLGGPGTIQAGDQHFDLEKLDCLYVGLHTEKVSFASKDKANPAIFYMLSSPAHKEYPTTHFAKKDAFPTETGSLETSNKRTIYRYIHADGIKSCQLVMGLTILDTGSVWNTMPAHTHTRRMEAYFYFDVPKDQRVIHLMGEPSETRHLVVNNNEAILSAPWSVHAGCGTSNYGFVWGMAGENYTYSDMDMVDIADLK
ncbi:4-deoxy-L-threo-5-hexulose uronate isomerase [Arachidicoccus rhizosphaerae]|jgi:4-deoxy-L-threo-5-hexosulose-uronate ketol-isomerase|uniref:4-deoxy-L-threo-5-hexosulose-uronate ketol-isomerase n=1 Tax=Arachidicoccus rhizosphaerae TaxID=551991 RepID=A0A1H3Z000_9BACT|nr:5-dehydro-4-deoxy-D-glucuronate isomerase [Arachidicoccus rhizosphaerae]SEA17007.1 4-deoxy-L-threo-5-hexulose uronate isomerase [Arachidicoccus rhizosphaerae]